jgi:hypothetical protein
VLNKVNDLVKLDKDKYSSQKNDAKLMKSDIHYFSNDHKKNPINLHANFKKTAPKGEKFKEMLAKDEENLTERDFRSDMVNKLLKKSDLTSKNIKSVKKNDNLTHTNILTTNCTDNKDSRSINLEHYQSNKQIEEVTCTTSEEAKNNIINQDPSKLVLVESDTLENDILLSIQKFGSLLRVGNSNSIKVDENHPDIMKLNSLLGSLKSGANESTHHMMNENNTIKRDTFINENYNKKHRENSLFNTIRRESIINGIYLNSDTRIKKYGIFFDFFSENIKEITNFLKPPENNIPQNFSPTSTLRIIEKTISNFETNKPTSNIISDISMFTESEKNDYYKQSLKKNSPNLLGKEITLCDYNCSDMQENAVVNKPIDLTTAKININTEINFDSSNQYNNNVTLFKVNSYEKKNSLLDLFENRSINSEYCKNGVVVDDDQIMKNLDFDLISNISSTKNVSKYFHMDSIRNNIHINTNFEDNKDPNTTIQFNNFSGTAHLQEKKAEHHKKLPMRIHNIKNKLNLDQTNKIEESPNQQEVDQTIIHNHFEKPAKENMINYIKTEKVQK